MEKEIKIAVFIGLAIIGFITISAITMGGFMIIEPELARAATSDVVVITLAVTGEVSISDCANFTMTGSPILGMTGGTATGECTWTAISNDSSGFNMSIKASSAPAMATGSYSFADYTEAGANTTPDYTWTVAASASEFGFTVEPATAGDTVQKFLDNGSTTCNISAGTNNIDTCWYHFATGDLTLINRTTPTSSGGEAEVVRFRAQVGSSAFQEEGTYQATITATVATN